MNLVGVGDGVAKECLEKKIEAIKKKNIVKKRIFEEKNNLLEERIF